MGKTDKYVSLIQYCLILFRTARTIEILVEQGDINVINLFSVAIIIFLSGIRPEVLKLWTPTGGSKFFYMREIIILSKVWTQHKTYF
jgi:hypothetical protein